jgi:hypothetical protein
MGRLVTKMAAAGAASLVLVFATGCSEDAPTTPSNVAGNMPIGAGGLGGAAGALPVAGTTPSNPIVAGSVAPPVAGLGAGGGGAGGVSAAGTGGVAGVTPPPPGGTGGMAGMGGMGGTTPPPPPGDWGTADPAMPGSFMTVVENNVGPGMAFTMFRPMMLTKKHPVITWGNGTGTMPSTYRAMLTHYASHGFVVIASNNTNVAGGTPPYMLQGVTWVLEQNANPMSPLFEHIDADHIGATGHSQGAFAASSAAADPRVPVWAPLQGARSVSGQHGPGLLICGTMDDTVPCSGAQSAFDRISTLPVMYAELKAASHVNWIAGGRMHPYTIATTGWFRVHLMGDTALKPMFYGPTCKLCMDSAWVIKQKMLD